MYCVLEMSTEVSIVPKPPVRVPGFEVNFCSSQTVQLQQYCFTVAEKVLHYKRVSLLPRNDQNLSHSVQYHLKSLKKKTAV